MSELEPGAVVVGSMFTGPYGQRKRQYEILADDGHYIETEIPVEGQLPGQLVIDFDSEIAGKAVPVLEKNLAVVTTGIEESRKSRRYERNFFFGVAGVLGGSVTSVIAFGGEGFSGQSTPEKALTIANALAYVALPTFFNRRFNRQHNEKIKQPLMEQAGYKKSIAALGRLTAK